MRMAEFQILRDLIYARTGLDFAPKKMYYVERRLNERLEANSMKDVRSYLRLLQYDTKEFEALINALTVNETYFFREYEQLRLFAEEVLPRIVAQKRKRCDLTLRVWSAGCSTGDEAYTLAIILEEMLAGEGLDYEVVATDINTASLAVARRGIYRRSALRYTPEVYLNKYFIRESDAFQVKPEIKRLVTFKTSNLLTEIPAEPSSISAVFCRNVLIYFDEASRSRAIDNIYAALEPGGYVFLGHSESMRLFSSLFEMERIGTAVVYKR